MRPGLDGAARLRVVPDGQGGAVLARQALSGPVTLYGHRDADELILFLGNASAGLLPGDRWQIDLRVESGARVLVTDPGPQMLYAGPGEDAQQTITAVVEAGAVLAWLPHPPIPVAGARVQSQTRITAAPGAVVLWGEALAAGRGARGEQYQMRRYRGELSVTIGEELAAREIAEIGPGASGPPVVGTLYLAGPPAAAETLLPAIRARLKQAGLRAGASRPHDQLIVVRQLGETTTALERGTAIVLATLWEGLGRAAPDWGRLGRGTQFARVAGQASQAGTGS